MPPTLTTIPRNIKAYYEEGLEESAVVTWDEPTAIDNLGSEGLSLGTGMKSNASSSAYRPPLNPRLPKPFLINISPYVLI